MNSPTCSICGGYGVLLGTLGFLDWFRCRSCGMDFSREADRGRVSNELGEGYDE
jgi:tRNA(Ile2) C34 agmatinyltransferase TiaS